MLMSVAPKSSECDCASGAGATVAILMATKDGVAFLGDQLESIAHQTHENWVLWASDDGSSDGTRGLLNAFARERNQTVIIKEGPQRGACANFMALAADTTIDADYFAYADQDDIWYADKLARAIDWLSMVPAEHPALYCGRTELIREDGVSYGFSPLFERAPDFRNALVQNIGGGNTMVFNRAAKRLLESVGPVEVVAHDWWTYQIVSAVGGPVCYDPKPAIKYRQHSANLVGSNLGWQARVARARMMLSGEFGRWNEVNIAALRALPSWMIGPGPNAVIERFARARSYSLISRLYYLWRSGVYRQNLIGNLGLLAATILKRI